MKHHDTQALSQRRIGTIVFASCVLLVLASATQLFGNFNTTPDTAASSVNSSREVDKFILYQLRIPRLLIGFIVGATLSLVGAAFQVLFRNPLATPSTVGTTAGAALGALAALVIGLRGTGVLPAATLFAFLGALLTSSLVLAVASSHRVRVEEILLAGIAVTLATGAIAQGLHALADADSLFAAAQWSLGQLPQVGYNRVLLVSLPAALCALLVLSQRRGLAALSMGEDWAKSIGVETKRVQRIVLVGGCLGVGASVALCGPIAFVGLLVPHLVRRSLRGRQETLLPLSWLAGGAFLVFCDTLSRFIIPGRQLPVGVLTASLGAPALFLLILRKKTGISP